MTIVCKAGDTEEHAFRADVTGMTLVVLGAVGKREEVYFKCVRLISADGRAVPLPLRENGVMVVDVYGGCPKVLGPNENGAIFHLKSGAIGIKLARKYTALEGRFVRVTPQNQKDFTVTITSSHQDEFRNLLPLWRTHLATLVTRDFAKDAQTAHDIEFEVKQSKIYQTGWPRGTYTQLVSRYAKIAPKCVKPPPGQPRQVGPDRRGCRQGA